MDEEHLKSLPKIRTFARDQAHVQHHDEPAVAVPKKDTSIPVSPIVVNENVVKGKKPTVVHTPHITVPVKKETPVIPSKPAAAHISAFHELKKSHTPEMVKPQLHTTPRKHSAPEPKRVSVKARKFEPIKSTSGGTIITDNKKSDFKVLPSIFSSLKTWLRELFEESQKTPKYTITTSDRRKGVIQKATSNNATIFTADNETLKEEIRRRQQAVVPHDGDLIWTPNTEVGVPLLAKTPAPTVAKMPVTISFKKQVGYLPPPTITEPRVLSVPAPAPRVFVPQLEPTHFVAEQILPPLAQIRITEALHNTTPVTPLPVPEVRPVVPVVVAPPLETQRRLVNSIPHTPNPKTSYLKNGLRTLTTFNTNVAAIISAGSVISLVLLILIVRTFLGLILPETNSIDGESTIQTLSQNGTTQDIAIASVTKEALYAALASLSAPSSGVKELRVVTPDGEVVPAQTLLSLLNFNTSQNLNQSVTSVHLGFSSSKRVIILEVTDPTTVFGALLQWEPTMANDLAPMLASGNARNDMFTDQTIGQTDVRILSENGTPILVYGFIDKNIVVITQDLEAFTAFLSTTP